MTRRAWRAIASTAASGCSALAWCQSRNTASTSCIAASNVVAIDRSPRVTSTPSGQRADVGSRVSARTSAPSASRPDTTCRPTLPLAPATRITDPPRGRTRRATFFGTTIRHASSTSSRVSVGGDHIELPEHPVEPQVGRPRQEELRRLGQRSTRRARPWGTRTPSPARRARTPRRTMAPTRNLTRSRTSTS